GSTGLDDAEWGVTLFARDTFQIKAIVYEMRFDRVSAEYADFGEFFIGIQLPLDELFRRLQLLFSILRFLDPSGWVTEWSIVHAWKACVPKGTEGSNPSPSASSISCSCSILLFPKIASLQNLKLLTQLDYVSLGQNAPEIHVRINQTIATEH